MLLQNLAPLLSYKMKVSQTVHLTTSVTDGNLFICYSMLYFKMQKIVEA